MARRGGSAAETAVPIYFSGGDMYGAGGSMLSIECAAGMVATLAVTHVRILNCESASFAIRRFRHVESKMACL